MWAGHLGPDIFRTEVVFVASDIALLSAAKQEKLAVINPEQDENIKFLNLTEGCHGLIT